MFSLVKNELIKIFSKKVNWAYIIIIIGAVIAAGLIQREFAVEEDENWREGLEAEISQLEADLAVAPDEDKEWLQSEIDNKRDYLENDINPNARSTWHFLNSTVLGIGMLVTLFSVIVGSASVASEFADGTIKQLLIRPHPRWAILLSKYLSVIVYAVLLMGALILSGYLVGLLFFGAGDFNAKFYELNLSLDETEAVIGTQFILKILYYLPSLLITITIAFMISTLFKSQAMAVGIGIFIVFVSSTLGGIIIMLAEQYTWAKFLIFPHMDLTVFALQDTILQDVTITTSLLILGAYYMIFMFITFWFFQKRDISI